MKTTQIGQTVEIGTAFVQGRGEVCDEFSGTVGMVAEIDGSDALIETNCGSEIWINVRRLK